MSVIDQRGLSVIEWTDYTGDLLWDRGPVPRLDAPEKWQEWGAAVLGLSALSDINLPNPYNYTDWRQWADRFNSVIDSSLS